jgi:ribosome biogenesis GTPase
VSELAPGPPADALALARLGWTDERARRFEPMAAAGLVPGRVSLEHNHVYRVLTAGGECLAEAAGRLKHEAGGREALPVVGDWVALRPDPAGGRSQIRDVLFRTTWFSRKVAGRVTVEQVLAANIDVVFVVFPLSGRVNLRGIERYLVAARRSGAAPVVVLNKADLEEAARVARGVAVHAVSVLSGAGVSDLAAYLSVGRTVALLGPSGAGKSSIVNRLVGFEMLPTGEVRPWDARGRHTSVHRQLVVRAEGGLIVDTPGIRELQLWETDAVGDTFDDITALAASCRFRDCRHDREPGCAVKSAVDGGALDADRYQSFLKLQREQQDMAEKRAVRDRQRPGR